MPDREPRGLSVAHFYHLFAAGEWREPVAEHLAALEDGGYDGPFYVGLVGSPEERAEALAELRAIRPPDGVREAEEGWEQVTTEYLHAHAREDDGATLYAHTKGAAFPSKLNEDWRRTMSYFVVRGWRKALAPIERGEADAAGCHWLTRDMKPEAADVVENPFFGGGFWLASNEYLRRLPPVGRRHRYEAELWIGLGEPRVVDLCPGWPGNYHKQPVALLYRRLSTSGAG